MSFYSYAVRTYIKQRSTKKPYLNKINTDYLEFLVLLLER